MKNIDNLHNKKLTDENYNPPFGDSEFKAMLDELDALAFTVDTKLQIKYINKKAVKVLQTKSLPDLRIGSDLQPYISTSCPVLIDIIQQVIRSNKKITVPKITITMPVFSLDISVIAKPIFDTQQQLSSISLLGQEVKEADPVSSELSLAANNWQTLFSNMNFFVWTYYFENNSIAFTQYSHRELDLPQDSNHRVKFEDFMAIVHPREKEKVTTAYRKFFNNPSKIFIEQRYRVRHKKGHYITISDKSGKQYNPEQQAVYSIGLFEDITSSVERENEIRLSKDRLQLALAAIDGAIWTFSRKNRLIELDTRHQEIMGLENKNHITFSEWFSFIHPDDVESVRESVQHMNADRPDFKVQYRMRNNLGQYFHATSVGRATKFDKNKFPTHSIGLMYDRSEEVKAQEDLRVSEERLSQAFKTAREGIWELYPQENRVFRSQSYLQILGYGDAESQMPDYNDLVHPDDLQRSNSDRYGMIQGEKDESVLQLRLFHRDGHIIFAEARSRVIERDTDGKALRIIGVMEDISERIAQQKEIEELAYYDSLTQLPNRRLVLERATQALQLENRLGNSITLMMLDLDKFKDVNDTLGHNTGDLVLKELASRFQSCMREMDTIGRQGGDEFIVVLPNCDKDQAHSVAERILLQASAPILVDGKHISCGVSIGIASAPENGTSIDELLRNADIAMYRAKEKHNAIAWFDPKYASQMELRIKLTQDLRNAHDDNSLELFYQPRISLETGKIISIEALLRWNHPEMGAISPAEFIPMAENSGLINKIGQYVIHKACQDLCAWETLGITTIVSINASAEELINEDYSSELILTLSKAGLSHNSLEIELTETAAISNWGKVINTLTKLDNAGIVISLDDWGTGYSSLSYLTQLPAHYVKLDRSFIENLDNDNPKNNTKLILKGMTALTHSLGFELVAEGIETIEQAVIVRELGCKQGQGYLFSKPLPLEQITELLRNKIIPIDF